jgi:hypothetical protein
MSDSTRYELIDELREGDEPVEALVLFREGRIWLGAEGYEDYHGTLQTILLERHDGRLVLRIWADKADENPTHTIDLEGARA